MLTLKIKPISVNECYRGRRFKTPLYNAYEAEMNYLLPKGLKVPEKAKIVLKLGFSNKRCDIDNPVKIILDILQKAYNFNDKQVYKLEVEKVDVAKGKEFISFDILSYTGGDGW